MRTVRTRSITRPLGLVVVALVVALLSASCAPGGDSDKQLKAWQDQVAEAWRHQLEQLGVTTTTTGGPSATTTTARANPGGSTPSTTTPSLPPVKPPASALTVRVSGAKLVDASGKTVQLRGVNRPGSNTPAPDQPVHLRPSTSAGGATPASPRLRRHRGRCLDSWDKAGASTHAINTVRVPLNEECWLGINGAPAAYSGANYQAFVKRLVDDLTTQGMHVILALHWGAPGSWLPGTDERARAPTDRTWPPTPITRSTSGSRWPGPTSATATSCSICSPSRAWLQRGQRMPGQRDQRRLLGPGRLGVEPVPERRQLHLQRGQRDDVRQPGRPDLQGGRHPAAGRHHPGHRPGNPVIVETLGFGNGSST